MSQVQDSENQRDDSAGDQGSLEEVQADQPSGADGRNGPSAGEHEAASEAEQLAGEEASSATEPIAQAPAGESDEAEATGAEAEESEEAEPADAVEMGPIEEYTEEEEEVELNWFILKVQVNREDSIRAAIERRIKIAGLDDSFGEVIVPTEDVVEFTKTGKKRLVKRKLYPGYLMIRMAMTDDAWFLIRETPGVGDFTGSGPGSRPAPMDQAEVDRIINVGIDTETGETQVKTAIPFKAGDRVRVKEGNFENFEGEVESIDEANGRVTVIISIFGRSTPVELEHWQVESI